MQRVQGVQGVLHTREGAMLEVQRCPVEVQGGSAQPRRKVEVQGGVAGCIQGGCRVDCRLE